MKRIPPSDIDDIKVDTEEKTADATATNEKPKSIHGASVTPASQKPVADQNTITVGTRMGSTMKETSVVETNTEATKADIPKEINASSKTLEVSLFKVSREHHTLEEREKVRKEFAEMQETLNQWALEYRINLKRVPDAAPPAPEANPQPRDSPKETPCQNGCNPSILWEEGKSEKVVKSTG